MRIGINLLLLQPGVGGVANYVLTLLRHWTHCHPADRMVLFCFPETMTLEGMLPDTALHDRRHLTDQRQILDHVKDVDVFFCPFGSLAPRPFPRPSVITMVDIQERFFPSFFSARDIANRLYHYDGSLQMADRVITISRFSQRSIVDILGTPEGKVKVIPLCPDLLPDTPQRPHIPDQGYERFAFYPANDWPHKNHLRLLDALAILSRAGLPVSCVWTGSRHEYCEQLLKRRDELGLTGAVTHLGHVTRSEMAWLYRNARCLVFPSLFEGFGIPLVEAMVSGLPIACSGTTSLPEVAGPSALYFDPENVGEMADRIRSIWKDDSLRMRLRSAGLERAARFSPRALVEEHRAVFQEAIASYRPGLFWKRQLLERPKAMLCRRSRVPAQQLRLAQSMLKASPANAPGELLAPSPGSRAATRQ